MDYDEGLSLAHKAFDRDKRKMTDRQFLVRMFSLTEKLCESANEHGVGSDEYEAVLSVIHELGDEFNRSRRRLPWLIIAFLFFLFSLLAIVVGHFLW